MTRASVQCITVQLMSKRKKLYDISSSASITTYFKKKLGKQCTGPRLDFFKYYESDIDMGWPAQWPRRHAPKWAWQKIFAALRAAHFCLNPPFPKPVSATVNNTLVGAFLGLVIMLTQQIHSTSLSLYKATPST